MLSALPVAEKTRHTSVVWALLPGLMVLLMAVPVALLIHLSHTALPQPEHAVLVAGGVCALLILLPSGLYLGRYRRAAIPARVGLLMLAGVCLALVALYFYWVSFYVFFPADIFIWAESEFVHDIVKFRMGYPLYTPEINNDSLSYTPGAQIFTYFLAWLIGHATVIPVYRLLQLLYATLATIFATLCCYHIVTQRFPGLIQQQQGRWSLVWVPLLFLIATNTLTNPYIHNLHNDSLGQCLSLIAYYVLLKYGTTYARRYLVLMMLLPVSGFLVKQNLLVWAILYWLYLAFLARPWSLPRLGSFTIGTAALLAVVLAMCYGLWGKPFFYWVYTVPSQYKLLPLRSVQHVLEVWVYFAIGLIGGWRILRGKCPVALFGFWAIWLCFLLGTTYTSGIGWTLNQIGPGSLLAGVWFAAALVSLWPSLRPFTSTGSAAKHWLQTGIAVASIGLLLSGLGTIRIPAPPLSHDAYRYIQAIENEFVGYPPGRVLLDVGTWIYARHDVVMHDKAVSLGDRGYHGNGDFSGIIGRFQHKHYAKVLVRNLHEPDFWYDHWLWPRSSGIKQALLEHYREVSTIEAVASMPWQGPRPTAPYTLNTLSVLVPKE